MIFLDVDMISLDIILLCGIFHTLHPRAMSIIGARSDSISRRYGYYTSAVEGLVLPATAYFAPIPFLPAAHLHLVFHNN